MNMDIPFSLDEFASCELAEFPPLREYEVLQIEEVIKRGEAAGCEVIRANDFLLLLDIDSAKDYETFTYHIALLRNWLEVEEVDEWKSRSGNCHIRIRLKNPLPMITRYGLQAALGSDGKRELLNYRDLAEGILEPCVLYKPK